MIIGKSKMMTRNLSKIHEVGITFFIMQGLKIMMMCKCDTFKLGIEHKNQRNSASVFFLNFVHTLYIP